MKKSEITKMLKFLNETYNDKFKFPRDTEERSEMCISVWYDFLKTFDKQTIYHFLKKLISENPIYPPTVMQLVNIIKENTIETDTYLEAYNEALTYFEHKSERGIRSEVVETIKKLGGWQRLGMIEKNDYRYLNEFKREYEKISEKKKQIEFNKIISCNNTRNMLK